MDAKLEELRSLYSHKNPNPSIAELIEIMADEILKRQESPDFQQRFQALQETLMRSQQQIAERERSTLAPIQERVMRAIASIAQRDKFTAVLQQQVVLWPQQSEMDITNEVIRKANTIKLGGPTPGPAPAGASGPK